MVVRFRGEERYSFWIYVSFVFFVDFVLGDVGRFFGYFRGFFRFVWDRCIVVECFGVRW